MRQFDTLTSFLLSKTSDATKSPLVSVEGSATVGDEGNAAWKFNGITGQTPSQSPEQLGGGLANDASGNQYDMVYSGFYNLKAFGITGAADETAILQAAFNALSDGQTLDLNGESVIIQNTFITANNVTIKNGKIIGHTDLNGVMLYITGDNVHILNMRSYIDGLASAVSKGTITFFETSGGSVTKCYLEGGRRFGTNNNVANMVCAAKCSDVIITDNVFFEAHFVEMVQLESSLNCVVSNNTMSSTGLAYSAIATTDNVYTIGGESGHVISNNTCTNYDTSIITVNTHGVTVTGNVVDTSGTEQGINLGHIGTGGAQDSTVTGNTVNNCAGAGILLADSENTVVSGNTIRNCGEAGIESSSTPSGIITGNFITDIGDGVTGDGVKLSSSIASSFTVTGNTFKNIEGNGVSIFGSIVDCIVTNNHFTDINTGGFGGGRFPVSASFDAVILPESLVFDGNTVTGTSTTNRVVSVANSQVNMIVSISNNVIPAITTTAQLWFTSSGGSPTNRTISKNKISTDPMIGSVNILNGATSVIVSNANQTPFHSPVIINSSAETARILTYVSSFGTGTFTISSRLSTLSDALVYYEIL